MEKEKVLVLLKEPIIKALAVSLPQLFLGWQFVQQKEKVEPALGQVQQKLCHLVFHLLNCGPEGLNYFSLKARGSDHKVPQRSLESLPGPSQ